MQRVQKIIITVISLFVFTNFWTRDSLFADTNSSAYKVKFNITNIAPSGSDILLSIHDSPSSFKKHIPYKVLSAKTQSDSMQIVTELPQGEYAVAVFQDINGDSKLNTNILGIPKEPFGFTNYDGKSVPGNFERHKIVVSGNMQIEIMLVEM